MQRIYLAVSYAEKDKAKALGARWDASKKCWYGTEDKRPLMAAYPLAAQSFSEAQASVSEKSVFQGSVGHKKPLSAAVFANEAKQSRSQYKSLHFKPLHALLGEDPNFGGSELFVDLVPSSCWFKNVRTSVHKADWDRLRHFIYQRAAYACECCSAKTILDAHERWYFDENTGQQILKRILALCKLCHEATHMGLANVRGRQAIAQAHLMQVNQWTLTQTQEHIKKAFALWQKRNQKKWTLNVNIISDSGIRVLGLDYHEHTHLANYE